MEGQSDVPLRIRDSVDELWENEDERSEFFEHLPYKTIHNNEDSFVKAILNGICQAIKDLDLVSAGTWTLELQNWLDLKRRIPRKTRASLATIYYHLAITPLMAKQHVDLFACIFRELVE